MIESAGKPLALMDGQIELEFVGGAARRIRPGGVLDHRTAILDPAFRSRHDTRGAVEKPRKLAERDRSPVIETARRMPFAQQLCDRRDGLRRRGRKLAQIDLLAGPARPHRRQRSNHAGIRIKSAQRVGLSACRAAGVEQKIVKVPKNEVVVAFGPSQAAVARGVDLEKDLAIHQQGEKLDPRKTLLPTQLFDLLRCRQHGDGGCNLRIANFEQRGGARRFQHHRRWPRRRR